jgi:Uma2 family endonuclease
LSDLLDWAREENLQPEPITLDIWKKLPEDFCRLVEIVNGDAVRAEAPARSHQKASHRLSELLDVATERHMSRHQDGCLDVSTDFDVLLWELPRMTVRRPDVALHECAPDDLRPLPASLVKLVVEIVSPGTEFIDTADKKAEYALAGIPWYWIVRIVDNRVVSIETYVLDHVLGLYRPHIKLEADEAEQSVIVDVPIRIKIVGQALAGLVRG